jgi:hypothetical protein
MDDLAHPYDASVPETEVQVPSTGHRSTSPAVSSASCQKINKLPASYISTCAEAEPIYATSSSQFGGVRMGKPTPRPLP